MTTDCTTSTDLESTTKKQNEGHKTKIHIPTEGQDVCGMYHPTYYGTWNSCKLAVTI